MSILRIVVALPCIGLATCVPVPASDASGDDRREADRAYSGGRAAGSDSPVTARGTDAFALLGRPFVDPVVEAFTGPGMQQCYVNAAAQIACPRLGINLSLNGDDVIRQVTAYLNALGAYRSYEGPLPFGLTAADTRTGVQSKLGRPDERLTDTDLYTSRTPRVSVTYHPEASPRAGRMRYLSVFTAR
jgi:hypothetical protein